MSLLNTADSRATTTISAPSSSGGRQRQRREPRVTQA